MLTIAYIGNGKSANRYHIPFVQTLPDLYRIKTIYSPRLSHDTWDKVDGVIYTTDIEDVMADQEIDLVVISTVLEFHYAYIKQALSNGKHVLCEKPFVATAHEARELFALAQEKGLVLQCYQNRRYDSDFLTVQKVIESGQLGDVFEVEMHFDYFRPEVPQQESTFFLETSFVYSHACHTLDQVLSYWGMPKDVHFDVRALLGQNRMNDYFDIDLFYDNLKISVKSSYFRMVERPSFVVYGREGVFVKATKDRQEEHLKAFYMPNNADFGQDLPEYYGILTRLDDEGKVSQERIPTVDGNYRMVYQKLYDTIVHGVASVVTPEQTIKQIELLEAAIASMKV